MNAGLGRRPVGRHRRRQAGLRPQPRFAARGAADRCQHRRRFRASRPQHLPRIDTLTYVLAGLDNPENGWGRRDETWSFMATIARSAAPTGSAWATATSPSMSSARSGSAPARRCRDHRRCHPPPRRRAAHPADERRSRADARAERDGWIDFQDYFVRQQCRPVVQDSSSRCGRGPAPARCHGGPGRQRAGGDDLPVQSLHQHRADPCRARPARRHREAAARRSWRSRPSSAAARSRDPRPR